MIGDLSGEQLEAIRRAAANGDYHLFLGAGSSRDSKDRNGVKLPGSQGLIDAMVAEFDVAAEDGDQLWRVYDRAVVAVGAPIVYDWLARRFWQVESPYWMSYFARSPWSTVWTLNIDDTFEHAYRDIESEASRRLKTLNWDDEYRQGRELNVVHLHGVVDRGHPRKLIFSLPEYAGSSQAGAAWPLNFRDSYGTAPFVILGARLRDEPDIEAVISRRHPTHAAPSFYVSTSISTAMAEDLRRWNLIPVAMSAEDFALEWSELTGLELDQAPTQDAEIGMRIGRQLKERFFADSRTPVQGHDFLGGDEPSWGDAVQNLVADTDWIRTGIGLCQQVGSSIPSASVIAFVGQRLTGRSAGLLAMGAFLRRNSWRTFEFVGDGRPDIEAIRKFASAGRSVAILFDGFADFGDDLEQLITESRAAGLRVLCIAVDEVSREANILGRIRTSNLALNRIHTINKRLTRSDASHLIDTLDRVSRLGFLEDEKSDRVRQKHFVGSEIFDSMAQLENAPGFGRRVSGLVDALKSDTQQTLVYLAALASRAGHPLTANDAARMLALDSDALVRLINNDSAVSLLVSTDGRSIRARHRWMALEGCMRLIGKRESLDLIATALGRAAPRLSRASQRERNFTSVLVGAWMSQRFLSGVFPGVDLEPWYLSLQPVFGDWSGRYWEQRAIVARRRGESEPSALSRAESFALRATSFVPDSFSLTTLGTVYLAKAAEDSIDETARYYERGMATFERAANADKANVIGWMAYLRYALPVRERARRDLQDSAEDKGSDLYSSISEDWTRIYQQLAIVTKGSEAVQSELKTLRASFDRRL